MLVTPRLVFSFLLLCPVNKFLKMLFFFRKYDTMKSEKIKGDS